jgi:transcriptional regulator with XRE-family HTH domain
MDLGKDIVGVVSKNVKAARLNAGLSQKDLAKMTGLSIRYISRLETKPQNVRIDKVALLARHMGIEPANLLIAAGRDGLPINSQAILGEAIRLLESLRVQS